MIQGEPQNFELVSGVTGIVEHATNGSPRVSLRQNDRLLGTVVVSEDIDGSDGVLDPTVRIGRRTLTVAWSQAMPDGRADSELFIATRINEGEMTVRTRHSLTPNCRSQITGSATLSVTIPDDLGIRFDEVPGVDGGEQSRVYSDAQDLNDLLPGQPLVQEVVFHMVAVES